MQVNHRWLRGIIVSIVHRVLYNVFSLTGFDEYALSAPADSQRHSLSAQGSVPTCSQDGG
eukprot:COSAG05_NODE_1937_length_3810_cov_2.941287_6_plen_60_part_00